MKKFLGLFSLLFFLGCGPSTHPNQWQYDSSSSFEEYKNSYLKGEYELAKDFLQKALKSAKSSSKLETLASIELGRVALRIALFKPPNFSAYRRLEPLINSRELRAYSKLLSKKLSFEDIKYLPKKYKEFAKAYLKGDIKNAKRAIIKMKSPISKMVAGALIKEYLDDHTIANIVDSISFYGYKVAVTTWLEFWIKKTKDKKLKRLLKQKLEIIKS
jgi:hypothetical protein